jgi:hypothetical protein
VADESVQGVWESVIWVRIWSESQTKYSALALEATRDDDGVFIIAPGSDIAVPVAREGEQRERFLAGGAVFRNKHRCKQPAADAGEQSRRAS